MLTLLGLNKILAVYVGPAGYAALGQFQNALQIITTFASGAINTGVIKYTAEYFDNEVKLHDIWRTAGTIALIGSVVTGVLVALFNQRLATSLLKDAEYGSIFIWFGFTLVFFVFNNLLIAILNGRKEISTYVIVNIVGSVFSLVVSGLMIMKLGLYGAFLALAINQSLVFLITLALCYRTTWFKFKYLIGNIDKQASIDLGKYTAMALTSAFTVPVSHMLVRNHLGETLGWDAAGYWEAMWRLSGAYLMLVTTTLSVYYLPRLSELKCPKEIKKEILKGYAIILPTAAVCGISIYLLRDFIIGILFTNEFIIMRDLFAWQIVGDTLKIGAWILAYLMIGQSMVTAFILTEIVFGFGFFGWTWLLIDYFGLQAASVAHAINYLAYWVVMYFLIKSKLLPKKNEG